MRCWHCNAPVDIHIDGWICTSCAQAGPPLPKTLPTDWRAASLINSPYIKRSFMLLYLTSFLRGFVSGATVFFIDLSLSLPLWARRNKTPIHQPSQRIGTSTGVVSTVAIMIWILYKLEN